VRRGLHLEIKEKESELNFLLLCLKKSEPKEVRKQIPLSYLHDNGKNMSALLNQKEL